VYPEIMDSVADKYFQLGFDKLNDDEKIIYCVWWLEAEVNNGGSHQYFFNSAGDYTAETLLALEKIGANQTKKWLEQAVLIAFKHQHPPKDRKERQAILIKLNDNDLKLLDDLDEDFYENGENITGLMNKYFSHK